MTELTILMSLMRVSSGQEYLRLHRKLIYDHKPSGVYWAGYRPDDAAPLGARGAQWKPPNNISGG
jgi:hypothetical protein